MKCQCNDRSIGHPPGKCPGSADVLIKRGNDLLRVCVDCTLQRDVQIQVEPPEILEGHYQLDPLCRAHADAVYADHSTVLAWIASGAKDPRLLPETALWRPDRLELIANAVEYSRKLQLIQL